MAMKEEQKKEIVDALQARGADSPCPRCGNKNFTLIDGFFNQSLQNELTGAFIIGGISVPSVGVVCNRCGFIAHHSLGILGLLPKTQESEEKNDVKNEAE